MPFRLNFALIVAALVWPLTASAQDPAATPSTTQSQSGYPDIRKEAADPSLFPNPDATARNTVRSRNGHQGGSASVGGAHPVKGGRSNDKLLGQADSDPLPIRVAYRRAKTLVMQRNPRLQEILKQADTANTDDEKRRFLRAYYVQLFSQVRRIDSSPAMKSHLDALQRVTAQRYDPKRRAVSGEEDLITGRGYGRNDRAR